MNYDQNVHVRKLLIKHVLIMFYHFLNIVNIHNTLESVITITMAKVMRSSVISSDLFKDIFYAY